LIFIKKTTKMKQ